MQSSGITVYTETSSSFIPLILHEEIQGILPVLILHSEDRELFDSFYMQKARRSSIQSTKTYKAFQAFQPQDLPQAFQFYKDIPVISDIPVIHDIPAFQALLHVPAFLQSECKFYTPIGFHQKLHRVPIGTFHKLKFFKEREML